MGVYLFLAWLLVEDLPRKFLGNDMRLYFAKDADAPARWEPGGADFFSPTLMEADLMRRVLPAGAFRVWFKAFLPAAAA